MEAKIIGVLERGLALLTALNRLGLCQVRDLHQATGLPKPTIVRLLESLIGLGYVARLPGGGYEVTAKLQTLSSSAPPAERLLKAARPALDWLRRESIWPADLAVFDQGAMRVVDVGRGPGGPFADRRPGYRLPLAGSALGRAYLAFCPESERRELLERARREPLLDRQETTELSGLLETARRKGFAFRDRVRGKDTRVLAKPIQVGERVVGCLSFVVGARSMTLENMERTFVAPLNQASILIARAYSGS
ncbi:MAG: helix-turn-helix domain-containing protein [Rhodospirillales bacterium]|nr:helix-turn-helix domain-containing protein [Rhodospirillales bacterium]